MQLRIRLCHNCVYIYICYYYNKRHSCPWMVYKYTCKDLSSPRHLTAILWWDYGAQLAAFQCEIHTPPFRISTFQQPRTRFSFYINSADLKRLSSPGNADSIVIETLECGYKCPFSKNFPNFPFKNIVSQVYIRKKSSKSERKSLQLYEIFSQQ